MRFVFCLAVVSLATASGARAADWATTFEAEAVRSYLVGDGLAVMVVPAGAPMAEVVTASKLLKKALRGAPNIKKLVPTKKAAALAKLEDEVIVKRVAKSPATQIFILRVFPGEGREPPSAVVTVYDKKGNVVGAFTGVAGRAMTAKGAGALAEGKDEPAEEKPATEATAADEQTKEVAAAPQADIPPPAEKPAATPAETSPGLGVSPAAAEAVSEVTQGLNKNTQQAQEEFEKRAVWFQDMALVNANTGVVVNTWSVPYKGKYKETLEGAKFYEYIGRNDLAQEYEGRATTRSILVWSGMAGWIVGMAASSYFGWKYLTADTDHFVSEFDYGRGDCSILAADYDACVAQSEADAAAAKVKLDQEGQDQKDAALIPMAIGAGVFLAGMVTWAIGFAKNPHPVEASKAFELADEFNKKLKGELGLTSDARPPVLPPEEPRVAANVAPLMLVGGGGLALTVTF